MLRRFSFPLIAFVLSTVSGFAQISFPGGGYPGGGYPGGYPGQQGGSGIPFPGSRRRNPNNVNQQTQNLTGTLRRISSDDLVIESEDKLIVTVLLANSTKYLLTSGNSGRNRDFQAGDRVSVDASQDDGGIYRAVRVTELRQGTADERAAASQPVDSSPIAGRSDTSNSGSSDDDGRPRLRRASNADDSSQPRSQASAPAPRDPDDPGPPQLRRSPPPASRSDAEPAVVADARPSIHAEDVNGVTRPPEAPQVDNTAASPSAGSSPRNDGARMPASGDPVIDQARDAAFSFSETLPNYVVKQFTTRYATEAARGGHTSWRALDTVTADVVSEGGSEKYKNILVDGRPPKDGIEKTGSWSSGEFSSLLQDVLSPLTNADFHGKRSTTIANRAAFRYDLSVEQPNSHWHVYAASQSYVPEYTGSVWIDKETFRVLRIELSARNIPREFPLDQVESAVDYDYVPIGDTKYLLPTHSEALSCERGTSDCSRNVIDFRNYKKFTADTSITFEPDK